MRLCKHFIICIRQLSFLGKQSSTHLHLRALRCQGSAAATAQALPGQGLPGLGFWPASRPGSHQLQVAHVGKEVRGAGVVRGRRAGGGSPSASVTGMFISDVHVSATGDCRGCCCYCCHHCSLLSDRSPAHSIGSFVQSSYQLASAIAGFLCTSSSSTGYGCSLLSASLCCLTRCVGCGRQGRPGKSTNLPDSNMCCWGKELRGVGPLLCLLYSIVPYQGIAGCICTLQQVPCSSTARPFMLTASTLAPFVRRRTATCRCLSCCLRH